jgi:hypothetical protein
LLYKNLSTKVFISFQKCKHHSLLRGYIIRKMLNNKLLQMHDTLVWTLNQQRVKKIIILTVKSVKNTHYHALV